MKSKKTWSDKYKGVPFEIQNFKIGGQSAWTFYLYFNEAQFDEDFFNSIWLEGKFNETFKRHIFYDYSSSQIANLDWHGGCTWYSKEGGHDGSKRVVKAGCDYQHYFDELHSYNEHGIEYDVKACIDSLYEITTPKVWCTYCGEYFVGHYESLRCDNCVDK